MAKYLLKRLFYLILTLFLIATITFFMMKLLPGTPLSNESKLSHSQIQMIYHTYGLDKPVWQQYLIYLAGMVRGNFGLSFQFDNQPVSYLLATRMPASFQLGIQAMIIGVLLGIIVGGVAAMRRNTWVDGTMTVISILMISIPSFVLAILLQYYVGLKAGVFPVAGWGNFSYTILPTIALAGSPFATTARFIRTEMVDVMSSDYIELAKAKGLTSTGVVYHHALRNSLIPLITLIGPLTVNLMTGSLVVENIFAVPGIGEQFVKSITTNDYPTIMGITMMYSVLLVVVLLITDIVYGLVDPRIRLQGGQS